jgi:hypothetical protein
MIVNKSGKATRGAKENPLDMRKSRPDARGGALHLSEKRSLETAQREMAKEKFVTRKGNAFSMAAMAITVLTVPEMLKVISSFV